MKSLQNVISNHPDKISSLVIGWRCRGCGVVVSANKQGEYHCNCGEWRAIVSAQLVLKPIDAIQVSA